MKKNDSLVLFFKGKYGEWIVCKQLDEGLCSATCAEIALVDRLMTEEEFHEFHKSYCIDGVSTFDKNNVDNINRRARNLGQWLRGYYKRLSSIEPFDRLIASSKIQRVLHDCAVLALDAEQFDEWVLGRGCGSCEEYVRFMHRAKRWLVDRAIIYGGRNDDNAEVHF